MYKVLISKAAKRDLKSAFEYIKYTLKNPVSAKNLITSSRSAFKSLENMPERQPIVKDEYLSKFEIRILPIRNYLAFYNIKGKAVTIIRFLYSKIDWQKFLK
ncbi:MAG: type II toxin-antitoxin system RelE/ParE family toxin [Erysipelotrichia bacterium]|nr:type II toxin-antitoxin system RelE/ParE family toxin [Erysipelotrichia bacterium]